METEKEQLLQELESLKKRIENLDEPKFDVGKWYRCPKDDFMVCCQYPNVKYNYGNFGYGFTTTGYWSDELCKDRSLIPATPSEVESALIKEAERRGFKEGVKFKTIDGSDRICTFYKLSTTSGRELSASIGNNEWNKNGKYISSNPLIFHKGQWATIIKDEPIKIGGYEVEFKDGTFERHTLIDGNKFTESFWQAAKLISEHSKAKIMVGCSKQFDVSLDIINKILSKLND